MTNAQIRQIAIEVIGRLAARLGADGGRGSLIAVFTGATAEFAPAVDQISGLVLDGFRVRLLFSESAEILYGSVVRDRLAGFPHIEALDPSDWLTALKACDAVVVPLLSMNTLSKVYMLVADNLATNMIVHALFAGKPLYAAQNGVLPGIGHWGEKIGASDLNPALRRAVLKRMATVKAYGCRWTDARKLSSAVVEALGQRRNARTVPPAAGLTGKRPAMRLDVKIVTAAHVRRAGHAGADLILPAGALITPLARDTAMTCRVALVRETEI